MQKPAEKATTPLTVPQLLDRQKLVIARPQALAAGMSRDAWRHRLESGRWQSPVPGIAIAHSGTPEVGQWEWVAVLHGGKDAALTGDAALVHFGAKRLTVVSYDIAVPPTRHPVRVDAPGIVIEPHRLRHLEKFAAQHDHLRLVNRHDAALHAAAWAVTDEEAEHRITLVVQQRMSSPIGLRTALKDMPRLPRRALIAEVLTDVELGATAQSELDFLRFCRKHGLPLPDEIQLKVRASGTKYVDAWYRLAKLILEIDGAHHRWVKQWEADVMRTLQLAVANRASGDQVLRVTRAMLRHHEGETAQLLRALLVP